MRNISDIIEQHIKKILSGAGSGTAEIKRSELADMFNCVPSQINYVISTRFTIEKGYVVESKRGGGGFIRITKVGLELNQMLHHAILDLMGSAVTAKEAEGLIQRLHDEKVLTTREARVMLSVVCTDILALSPAIRDQIRANYVSAMLVALLKG
ncbi:transcriptional regulator [Tumebacillus algifaecis]|uniref:Transcriptional regulator CtsR n=1 Tax=Tumebacillus algifaecis TaxID=1214604 RepID=A0A223D647_9BACL|nr:CtsR family transcriptional regulator [Tumebacillus algifaecis]ASS76957.1 transcriptional regulator [Tumebacillus algifaecis]